MSVVCTAYRFAGAAILAFVVSTHVSTQPSPFNAELEFFAVAPDGGIVRDLDRAELTLRIGGRVRTITAMRWVPPAVRAATPLDPPFGTNVQSEQARAMLLVLDEHSFRPGREHVLRNAADAFLNQLTPDDRVALVTVPYGGLKTDLTTSHDEVRQAVHRIVGQSPTDQSGSDFACRTRRTLESIAGLLDSLRGGQGPTTVLLVSAGLAPPRRDAAAALAPGMCELTTDHFEQVANAASAARAHFFIIQPDEALSAADVTAVETIAGAGFTGSANPLAGLENLAGVTGGRRFQLTNPKDSGLERAARETAGHYVISFVAEPSERNGRRHAVDLGVARDAVQIRARPTLLIPRPDTAAEKSPAPREMLRQGRAFSSLPLRTIGYASRDDGKNVKVLVAFDAVETDVVLKSAAAGLFDAKGRLTAQWTAASDELAASPVFTALLVPPGRYRLRVAAIDGRGRSGAADYAVVAELPRAGDMTTSALVLGLSRADGFHARMQFVSEPVATGYVEVYGAVDTATRVTMEIARDERSAALVTVPAVLSATSDPDRRIATAALPIGAIPAGDYVVRAVVAAAGASTVVKRTLRKGQR